MSQEITVRRAEISDVDVITGFNRAMALETEGIVLLEETSLRGVNAPFRDPSLGFYLVAECDSKVVGSLMITTEWSDWRAGNFWCVQSVYVLPDFRRRGIYRRLYKFVQEMGAANPEVCGFRLYTERNNAKAQQTYKALGMEELEYTMFEELKDELEFRQ
ncbi:MAG: GNAT family N-acetyltransferase [Phycisphaerae bacterium]|nr:GNAT family N-acetyltransferase [Phycisphaerae bacterium]MDP7288419.1 GNAT family N-acetyltransferase [Phycisphaerae bacterium]